MAPIEKKKGFRHLLAAGGYSFQGFMRLLKEEAFRHELIGFVIGLVVFFLAGASAVQFMIFVILMTIGPSIYHGACLDMEVVPSAIYESEAYDPAGAP